MKRVAIVMHAAHTFDVLERWVFDVEAFPGGWGDRDQMTYNPALVEGVDEESGVNWTDVSQSLRGALVRVSQAAEKLSPLPEGSTFTLAVELRDEANAPIGVSVPWIVQTYQLTGLAFTRLDSFPTTSSTTNRHLSKPGVISWWTKHNTTSSRKSWPSLLRVLDRAKRPAITIQYIHMIPKFRT